VGHIDYLRLPAEGNGVRVDSGVREGDAVSPYYDSMIAKIITHGADRGDALQKLRSAVSQIRFAGLTINAGFLLKLLTHAEFTHGGVNTGFIPQQEDALIVAGQAAAETRLALGAIAVAHHRAQSAADCISPWRTSRGWRMNQPPFETISVVDGDTQFDIVISRSQISFSGNTVDFSAQFGTGAELTAIIGGVEIDGAVVIHRNTVTVFCDGETSRLQLFDILEDAVAHAGDSEDEIPLAPMPGVVVAVLVEPGAMVKKGEPLMVIEAMKVEHTIRATVDGAVKSVYYKLGETVDDGAQLVDFIPDNK
jgi:3-methylcrotonyl-CoA carboxylase alpha subunit